MVFLLVDASKWSDRVFTEYGLAMLLALAAGATFFSLYRAKANRYDELVTDIIKANNATIGILKAVELRLSDQQGMKEEFINLKNELRLIRENLQRLTVKNVN